MTREQRNRKIPSRYEPGQLPVVFRKKRELFRKRNKTLWTAVNRNLRAQWDQNLIRYNALDLDGKIAFARRGYKFSDQPDCPAILVQSTCIRMPIGSNEGVMAHKLFEALPVGFVILFSKKEIVAARVYNEIQSCYQVSIPSGRIMLTHTELKLPHGYAQLVNHPTKSNRCGGKHPLRWRTKQNMMLSNCRLQHTTRPASAKNIADYPAYLRVIVPVPVGHELLYCYGPAHRLI